MQLVSNEGRLPESVNESTAWMKLGLHVSDGTLTGRDLIDSNCDLSIS